MICLYRIRPFAAVFCLSCLVLPAPLPARNRKGDKLLKQGAAAESAKDYDRALAFYDQAVTADPNEAAYLLADQKARGKASDAHVTQGKKFQAEGQLEQALSEFQKAFIADPGSAIAVQSIRDTTAMIKAKNASPGQPVVTPAERARLETERRLSSLEGPPVLRPLKSQIEVLSMNNQPARLLYEGVAKLAGINVLFDPSGIDANAGKNYNLDLRNVTLEEALNYVALETHTFWKPISRNAIFVTLESDPKRQEYQDEVVRVFYIQNASTQAEFTEIFNAVRTGSRLTTGLFSVLNQNAIIARGSVDTMYLIEKLIHDLDRPKAEVSIDVVVMSVNRTLTRNLGNSFGNNGLSVPFTFTPRNPTTTGSTGSGGTSGSTNTTSSAVTIAKAGSFSSADYSVTFPSTTFQALLNDARTRIVQRPQVRSTDGGKASIIIGSQIPYVSGSLNSAVATPGAIPYATTQFQQVKVGTSVEFAPHVNGPEDISMHVKVDLTSLLQRISIAGIEQPVIGQQTNEADIRMKDGEVSILGGLSDKELNQTLSGIPGFTSIPVLKYLFGTDNRTKTDNEILIAIIPHIVRAQDPVLNTDLGVYAGSERLVRVARKPESSTPAGNVAPIVAPPSATSPLSPAPGKTPGPVTVPGSTDAPAPAPPSVNRGTPPAQTNTPTQPPPSPAPPLQ